MFLNNVRLKKDYKQTFLTCFLLTSYLASYVNSIGKFFFLVFFRHSHIYSNSIPGAFENDIKWICFLKTTKTSIQLNIGRTFLRKEEQRHLNGTSLIFTLSIYIVKHTVLAHNQIKWPWWMCNPRFHIICMTYMYAMEIQMVTLQQIQSLVESWISKCAL